MNRIDRLLGMLTFLQGRKYATAEKLAEKFHISIRTVYRDIKALGEQGIPVDFEPNKGYFIMQGYFLPPVSFSSDEAAALVLMESLVDAFGDLSIQKNYAAAMAKVKAVLRGPQLEMLETLAAQTKMQIPACMAPNYEYLGLIQNAIVGKLIVEVDYLNNQQQASIRRVEPIGLVFYALSWHLIAWCHLRNEYRDFRVSRIKALRLTSQPFLKTDHIALADYMQEVPVPY